MGKLIKVYTNQQIRDMVYTSENEVIWNFLDLTYKAISTTRFDSGDTPAWLK